MTTDVGWMLGFQSQEVSREHTGIKSPVAGYAVGGGRGVIKTMKQGVM